MLFPRYRARSRPLGSHLQKDETGLLPSRRSCVRLRLSHYRKPGNLQSQIILIRPEPRHSAIVPGPAEYRLCRAISLFLRRAPALDTDALIDLKLLRKRAAIAHGIKSGIGCLHHDVGSNTIIDDVTRGLLQFDIRQRADAGKDHIASDFCAVGKGDHACRADCGNRFADMKFHTFGAMPHFGCSSADNPLPRI